MTEPDLIKLASQITSPAYKLVSSADGDAYAYRRVNSLLERRKAQYTFWEEITGEDFRRMTPEELRHVADILEGKGGLAMGGQWVPVQSAGEKP